MKIMKVMISIVVILASFLFVSTGVLAVETLNDSILIVEEPSTDAQIEAYDEEEIIDDENILQEKAADGDIEGEEPRPLSDGKFEHITDLYLHWEMNGYPDYVGFVFSTDGTGNNLTVLLVDETAEEQIRSSLLSEAGLSFGRAEYSYNELLAVSNEISAGGQFYHVGIGWTEVNGEVSGFGPSGKEPRIIVGVDESIAAEQTEKLKQAYGDMVVVQVSDEPVLDAEQISKKPSLLWLLPALTIVLVGLLFLLYRRQSSLAMQTNTGSVVTGSSSVSRKQVIEAVKDSEVEPSEEVLKSILHKIDEEKD